MGGVNSCGSSKGSDSAKADSTRHQFHVESLVICSLCLQKFEDPRMLKCQHTFCFNCLKNHVKNVEESGAREITCPAPQCRKWLFPIKPLLSTAMDRWDTYFPKNITISKILENLPNDEEYCDVHTDKLYEYFCEQEMKLCCSTCVIHRHKKCNGICQISEFTEQPSKFASVSRTLLAELKKCRGQSHTVINQLKNNVQKLVQQRDVIFNDLEKFRLEIISELEKNEKAIKDEVNQLVDEKYEQIEIMEELEKKFTEYNDRISNHEKTEIKEKLRSLQIVDKFAAQDVVTLRSLQNKFKTVHIEYTLDKYKETQIKKQLGIIVGQYLVSERSVY